MKKRISAFALALVMVLALLPAGALAANSDFDIRDGILHEYTGTSTDAVIPEGVTGIAAMAFSCRPPLKSVFIPLSVTWIGDGIFFESGVEDIYYEGTKEQWEKITISTTDTGEYGNYAIFHATMHYNSPMPATGPAAFTNAAQANALFPPVQEYPNFRDVPAGEWYYDPIVVCSTAKIMVGVEPDLFSPFGLLSEEQAATLAARLRAALAGEAVPEAQPGEAWYAPVMRYLEDLDLGITPGIWATRGRFLEMLGAVLSDSELAPIQEVDFLPDTNDENVLRFYRAGILTGMDPYGTFSASRTLSRAEAAAMVARIIRPELRLPVSLADYTPFQAAGTIPSAAFFTNGVTAEQYLKEVNELIGFLEDYCVQTGIEFNWVDPEITYEGKTFLAYVTETALTNLGVTRSMGTQAYGTFNLQVYYSRLIDLRGGRLLGSAGTVLDLDLTSGGDME